LGIYVYIYRDYYDDCDYDYGTIPSPPNPLCPSPIGGFSYCFLWEIFPNVWTEGRAGAKPVGRQEGLMDKTVKPSAKSILFSSPVK